MNEHNRFSSRREKLDKAFLRKRLRDARSYDRISGYFSGSILELISEELESVTGRVRVVCNSAVHAGDVVSAKAAMAAQWKDWAESADKLLLEQDEIDKPIQDGLRQLYKMLKGGKLEIRVLPDDAFGLIHGKAGVITLSNGERTSFIGSANDTHAAWRSNYELVWEDNSPEAINWTQEEFDALWSHPKAYKLSEAVVEDLSRFSDRTVVDGNEWKEKPDPASVIIESPVYRHDLGLWQHQKYFVKKAFEDHIGPMKKARYVLADQVGLGKTIQLALTAQLIGLTGDLPILVLCPKTLVWQWQDELKNLLDLPAAVWDGKRWIDESKLEHPSYGAEGIKRCPRKVGIVSTGLVVMQTEAREELLKLEYECVILDEAHKARRKNLGKNKDHLKAEPSNLMDFMLSISPKTKTLLLATATPVQLRPIEAYDLLKILNDGDESVLGNSASAWRKDADGCLRMIMKQEPLAEDETLRWEMMTNPLPSSGDSRSSSGMDISVLRSSLRLKQTVYALSGKDYLTLDPMDRQLVKNMYVDFMDFQNPYIRKIIRRTRDQLEKSIDPNTNEPFLKSIKVRLFGEQVNEAILLPAYLEEAYQYAEEFCELVGKRQKSAGFLRTLVLRRLGSSIAAGLNTAKKFLGEKPFVVLEEDEAYEEDEQQEAQLSDFARSLTKDEKRTLERMVNSLSAFTDVDPKFLSVEKYLTTDKWLDLGCIVFSQYRDSLYGLSLYLSNLHPDEPIALYSGSSSSGIIRNGKFKGHSRERIKELVRAGEIRLMLGTDAASEGLNLQRLGTLINLDLPWNPTRLEQRKGRIQRIGQQRDEVFVYNMRYQGSVEDRVHDLLSNRLEEIFDLFGQLPDVLEDVWVATAMGEVEQARLIIDEVPRQHPFNIKNTNVEPVNWETCAVVLNAQDKWKALAKGWGK